MQILQAAHGAMGTESGVSVCLGRVMFRGLEFGGLGFGGKGFRGLGCLGFWV